MKKGGTVIKKQNIIEDLLNEIGFRERIVIGLYDEGRLHFHVDFSEDLANGLMTAAFMDKRINKGIRELISNLENIIEEVGEYKPNEGEGIH